LNVDETFIKALCKKNHRINEGLLEELKVNSLEKKLAQ
jgi:hypothetical protein